MIFMTTHQVNIPNCIDLVICTEIILYLFFKVIYYLSPLQPERHARLLQKIYCSKIPIVYGQLINQITNS